MEFAEGAENRSGAVANYAKAGPSSRSEADGEGTGTGRGEQSYRQRRTAAFSPMRIRDHQLDPAQTRMRRRGIATSCVLVEVCTFWDYATAMRPRPSVFFSKCGARLLHHSPFIGDFIKVRGPLAARAPERFRRRTERGTTVEQDFLNQVG